MILAMAMLLFQFPAARGPANQPQLLAIESSVSTPARTPEDGKPVNTAEPAVPQPLTAPMPRVAEPAQPAGPIVEPPTSFLSADVYNPPPPQLLDFEEAPVMHPKAWFLLSMAEHSSAAYDAWSTRRALNAGRVEADPVMRPFAGSPAIYGAIQIIPVGLDYLARRLQRSSGWTRHIWWAPQSIATATYLFSGSYNISHTP